MPLRVVGPVPPWFPAFGCLVLVAFLAALCLLPFALVDLMHSALEKLHLSPAGASLVLVGIFLGSFFSLPIHRIARDEDQPVEVVSTSGLWYLTRRYRYVRRDTLVAVNVGGCVVPVGLAVWELSQLRLGPDRVLLALLVVAAVNIAVCYRAARPVPGLGILLPALLPPLVAVLGTWLLLPADRFADLRAPVAYVAGVLGPLVGADLLNLRRVLHYPVGIVAIGGAGTFDGIVLSGLLAALLA